jgi:hypothetical protein
MIAVPAVRRFAFHRLGLVIAIAAVCGCPRRPLRTDREPTMPARPTVYVATNRNIDLLFLIDDSSSMRLSQDNLRRNFPVLMQQLENLPGGLPNIHVAVVSSDLGAGDGSISGCDASGGDRGIFQSAPGGGCRATGLAAGATYISNVGGVANYTGDLANVFTCIAALGESGCGFERQFGAITRALGVDGRAAPAENQGFLRPDAMLAVVMITNEDDCSALPGAALYDTTANRDMASQLGPPANFRCNEFGHLCNGSPPKRFAPNADVNAQVAYDGCTSNDEGGSLLAVRDTADRIKSLKADDGQIMVAAITGPRAPYVVHWRTPSVADFSCGSTGSCPWPEMGHSCIATDGSFADPAVRISELVDDFGATGSLLSICDGDFAPALGKIGDIIVKYVNAPCILGRVAKRPNTAQDDCTVVDVDTGNHVPSCDETGGAGACWRLVAGGPSCGGVSVSVQADPLTMAAPPGNLTVQCNMCIPGTPEPARDCP